MSELGEIWKFFGIHFYLVLINVSINFFDQLVIVTCDTDMEGLAL